MGVLVGGSQFVHPKFFVIEDFFHGSDSRNLALEELLNLSVIHCLRPTVRTFTGSILFINQ